MRQKLIDHLSPFNGVVKNLLDTAGLVVARAKAHAATLSDRRLETKAIICWECGRLLANN